MVAVFCHQHTINTPWPNTCPIVSDGMGLMMLMTLFGKPAYADGVSNPPFSHLIRMGTDSSEPPDPSGTHRFILEVAGWGLRPGGRGLAV